MEDRKTQNGENHSYCEAVKNKGLNIRTRHGALMQFDSGHD